MLKTRLNYNSQDYYQKFVNSACKVNEDEARLCTVESILNSYVSDPIAQLSIGVKQALKPDNTQAPGHYDVDDYVAMNDPCCQGITNLDRINAHEEINNFAAYETAAFSRNENSLPSEADIKKAEEPLAPAQSGTPSSELNSSSVSQNTIK